MLAAVIIIVAAIYPFADAGLRTARIGDPLGPKAFPALVGGCLILSAVLLVFETLAKRRTLEDRTIEPRTKDEKHLVLVMIGMVVWSGLYYYVFETLGYLIATPLFLFGLLSYFNQRKYLTNVLVALGFTGIVYLLFSILLGVPLPSGPLRL